MKVYRPSFIGRCHAVTVDVMLWHHSVTISWKLNCKYIKQPWFEWKAELDINFKHKKYENDNQYKY